MAGEDYLDVVNIIPDKESHVFVIDDRHCASCPQKACLNACPAGVFHWDEALKKPIILWYRCLECAACEHACPGNISFRYPRGGFGVTYHV